VSRSHRFLIVVFTLALAAAACSGDDKLGQSSDGSSTTTPSGSTKTTTVPATSGAPSKFKTVPGMPPVIDDNNIYSFNHQATKESIKRAVAGEPKARDVLAKRESVKHPFSPK